ncbi:hypothetical protein [Granulicella tundricola]|nr:hypothetical protein [Granulicella tundricola]
MSLLCLVDTGCVFHHKTRIVLPAAPPTQVPLASAPEPAKPPVVAQVPLIPTPVTTVKLPEKKKPKKKKPVIPTAAPTQIASSGVPTPEARDVIGALTAGGDATPEKKLRAADMIGDLEKRLSGLAPTIQDKQKDAIARVRYFQHEARTALDSGDADGAVTLATKAKLLLDDLSK